MISLLDNKKARFILFGGYNTVVGYALFTIAYLLLESTLHYTVISVLSHFISVSHSFFIQRRFVFRSSGAWPQELWRFHLAYLVILPIGLLILWILHEVFQIPVLLAQGLTLILVVILSYLSSTRFTFRRQ